MQDMQALFILSALLLIEKCYGNWGDAFGLISRLQTFCELDSMTTASRLSDMYNSMDEAAHKADRMKQEYVIEHLGFGWEYAAQGKAHAGSLEHDHNADVLVAQSRGGWASSGSVPPAYKSLEGKWVYFYGDHTLRHITSTFLHPRHGKEMFASKEWTTSKCTAQAHRGAAGEHTETTSDAAAVTDSGNHHATHNYKAKTCHFPGFGTQGKITYDWKHTPYDEYDQWMFGADGYWGEVANHDKLPDILVIQIGHSTCLPAFDVERAHTELQHGDDVFNTHVAQVELLMDAIKAAVGRPHVGDSSGTTVIVATAPRAVIGHAKSEICMWKLNRIVARAAHQRGFIVLEREEIEHRVTFKSEAAEDLTGVGALDPTEAPVAEIVSTALLSMITCLVRNVTEPPSV